MKSIKEYTQHFFNMLGYKLVKIDNSIDVGFYEKAYGLESVRGRKFYNIGAGSFSHPCWTNLDHKSDWYGKQQKDDCFLEYDILAMDPLPLQENSAEIFYTSHTIEHITDDAALHLFSEVNRVLKTGGIFRITAPNIDLHYQAYLSNDRHFFYWTKNYQSAYQYRKVHLRQPLSQASTQQLFLYEFATHVSEIFSDSIDNPLSDAEIDKIFQSMEFSKALDSIVSRCSLDKQRKYPGNHINWWNRDKVINFLQRCGFKKIFISGYGQSIAAVMRDTEYFDNTHPKISLYIEAEATN
ncbi:MAG: methyltransferase domain-containing protein [Gammaproteobacteria bacterium]